MSLMNKLTGSDLRGSDATRAAIVRNICALISSRAPIWPPVADGLLETTLARFGMQNTTRAQSKANSNVILAEISDLIRRFEPRLSHVDIQFQTSRKASNQLQFRISAVMGTAYGAEALVLESSLDLTTRQLDVRNSAIV